MTKSFYTLIILLLALASLPLAADNHDAPAIKVEQPWARPTPPVEPINAAAYMTLKNQGDNALTLTAVSTPITKMASLHQTRHVDGKMRMEPVKDGLAIPAGERVELKPGSYHMMLMHLSAPLEAGDQFPVTLTFSDGRQLEVQVNVEER